MPQESQAIPEDQEFLESRDRKVVKTDKTRELLKAPLGSQATRELTDILESKGRQGHQGWQEAAGFVQNTAPSTEEYFLKTEHGDGRDNCTK